MTAQDKFMQALADCPLVAILRGIRPDEAEAIGDALYEGGIRIMEVPLNSPDPFESISRMSKRMGARAVVGAGTVLNVEQVEKVRAAGGSLIVSPSTKVAVIEASVAAGMVSCPGYFTPSEAFTAIDAGAHALKLFPAEALTPAVVKAQRAVLPKHIPLLVVGGVKSDAMAPWLAAGANGFGLGSGVYVPGTSPDQVLAKVQAYRGALGL